MPRRKPFAAAVPKTLKTKTERTDVWTTPLAIRSRIPLDEATRAEVRVRLGRKLGKFALHVDRVSVRFEDLNGPRGGVDILCRVKVVLRSLPSIVVEERAADPRLAIGRAAEVVGQAVQRSLRKSGWSAPRGGARGQASGAGDRAMAPSPRDDEGSLIGRRVGRGKANLEKALARPEKGRRDVYVDTAAPGTSASDRKAGYGSTAARNTKRNTAGMLVTLEDSRTTPSRKTTRKSKNRAKSAVPLERTTQMELHKPAARASRARAAKR
jgi:hypothetical protein